MPLSRKEIEGLMRQVSLTKDSEIDCEECLALVAEFAEQALAGKPIPDALRAIEHHLSVCCECCEEYEALRQVLDDLAEGTDGT